MKDIGIVKIPKGTAGYESHTGHNGWWYPNKEAARQFPIATSAEHLSLWKNQDPYFVFKVPLCAFKPDELFNEEQQFITIWLHQEAIDEITNSQNA